MKRKIAIVPLVSIHALFQSRGNQQRRTSLSLCEVIGLHQGTFQMYEEMYGEMSLSQACVMRLIANLRGNPTHIPMRHMMTLHQATSHRIFPRVLVGFSRCKRSCGRQRMLYAKSKKHWSNNRKNFENVKRL